MHSDVRDCEAAQVVQTLRVLFFQSFAFGPRGPAAGCAGRKNKECHYPFQLWHSETHSAHLDEPPTPTSHFSNTGLSFATFF